MDTNALMGLAKIKADARMTNREYQRDVELRLQLLSAMMIDLVPMIASQDECKGLYKARKMLKDINAKYRVKADE